MKNRNLLIAVVFVLLMLAAFPVFAQDTTPAPDVAIPVSTLVFGLVLAGALSGVGVGIIWTNFLHSKQNRDAAEQLFLSTPPETQKQIRDIVTWLQAKVDDAFEFADVVTDGKTNE